MFSSSGTGNQDALLSVGDFRPNERVELWGAGDADMTPYLIGNVQLARLAEDSGLLEASKR